jgi:hypothetical protein
VEKIVKVRPQNKTVLIKFCIFGTVSIVVVFGSLSALIVATHKEPEASFVTIHSFINFTHSEQYCNFRQYGGDGICDRFANTIGISD